MDIRSLRGAVTFLLALVALAGFAWALSRAMDTTSYNTWGAMIWCPVIIGLTLLLLSLALRNEPDRWVVRLVYLGYFAKLLGISARYFQIFVLYGGGDATRYNAYAARWYFEWRNGVFEADNKSAFGTHNLELVTTAIYTVFGPSAIVGFLVFGTLAFVGTLLILKAFREAVPEGNQRRYTLLLLLLPSILFWPSSIGKEAFLMLGVGLTALGLARFLGGRHGLGLVHLGLGLTATALIRPHLTVLIVVGVFMAQLLRKGSGTPASMIGKAVGLVLVGVAAVLAINQAADFLGIEDLTVEGVAEEIEWASGQTETGGSNFVPVPLTDPLGIPAAIVTVLFRPFPWEANNALVSIQGLEGVALMVLTLLGLRRLAQVPRLLRSNPWVAFCVVYVLAFILAFSGFANFAIVARQRVLMIPFFLALLALPDPKKTEDVVVAGSRRERINV